MQFPSLLAAVSASVLAFSVVAPAVAQGAESEQGVEFARMGNDQDTYEPVILIYNPSTEETRAIYFLDSLGLAGYSTSGGLQVDGYGNAYLSVNDGLNPQLVRVNLSTGEAEILGPMVYDPEGYWGSFYMTGYAAAKPFVTGLQQEQFQEALDREVSSVTALAGALDIELPVGDAHNRIGFSTGTSGDTEAFGMSYSRVIGQFDFGAAYARSERGDDAGRVRMGYSW